MMHVSQSRLALFRGFHITWLVVSFLEPVPINRTFLAGHSVRDRAEAVAGPGRGWRRGRVASPLFSMNLHVLPHGSIFVRN